ncbi:basic proline-rich protein-like [Lynx canadensis]|uniref:basic proline-rich protein-like n=1 Tax=Lynx canadensis TaxID=61383 RepID=UPI0013C42283|nr:basic proline-rich protein-like [Lynx canadensis]
MTAKDTSVSAASQPGQRRRAHTRHCPPPAPTEKTLTLTLTLTLTTGGDRQRRRPAPLGKPSVDHVRGPPGSDRLRAWPAPPGPSASIPPTRLRSGPEAPASARPAARGPHAVHPARWQHPQNAARRPPSHPHAASGHVPSAQRPAGRHAVPHCQRPAGLARRAPERRKRSGGCVGRESNPGQLLGRQLCSPLYHQRCTARAGPTRPAQGALRAFSPWRSLAAAAAAAPPPPGAALPRRPARPQLCPATTGCGHHGLRPPGAPASPLRLSCAGRSPGAPRPAPGAPRPAPTAARLWRALWPPGRSRALGGRLGSPATSPARRLPRPPRPAASGPARPGPAREGAEGAGARPHHLPHPDGTGPSCLPPERHPRRLRGWAAGRHVAEELAVAAAGTTRGPGCAVATQRPASSHAKGWGRWAVGRPGTRRRTAEKKRPCPSGARGGTQSCAGHQKGRLASPSGNRTPVSRVTGGDTHHYTNEDGGGRPPGRPTPLRLPPHACPCLPPTPCPARAPDTGHAPPDPSPASAPSPARQPPAPTPSPPGPGAHTRTRTALSTPNERCLSLVCQAGIAPGEKAPDGKRGCEGEGEGEGSWGWGCDCDGSRAGGGGGGGGGGGEAAGRAPPGPPRVSRPLRTHTAASRAP